VILRDILVQYLTGKEKVFGSYFLTANLTVKTVNGH